MNEKIKVIIDADPGVDDTMALVFALVNDRIDIASNQIKICRETINNYTS